MIKRKTGTYDPSFTQKVVDKAADYLHSKALRKAKNEETEQLDEVKHRVGRKTPYSKKVIVKTKGQLAKEKSGRIKLAKSAAREAKKTGEKVKIQPFGDWRRIRASAKRKIKE